MKNLRAKEKFVELRAEGLSFDKISSELGVSKPTLIKWDREFSNQIANIHYFNTENLLEKHRLVKQFRIEGLSRTLSKALSELDKRDFSNISTQNLLSIIHILEAKLKNEVSSIHYHTGDIESRFDLNMDLAKEKTIPLFY